MKNKIQKKVSQGVDFLKASSKLKYTLILVVTAVMTVLFKLWLKLDMKTIIAALLGVLFAEAFTAFLKMLFYVNEDRRKVYSDNEQIEKIYSSAYMHVLEVEGKRQNFYYDISYVHQPGNTIIIKDYPSKKYTLPGRIENNFAHLFLAHGNSYIENQATVRLDDFHVTENKELILETSRSDYYSHLASNRAMDYLIDRKVSIRTLYEYGPLLSPLKESRLSNHIGINALVFFSDGAMILKHRRKDATISKNRLTSSVATRLIMDDYREEIKDPKEIMEKPIRKVIFDKLCFPGDTGMKIDFLGFARDVYEGGKPQFYFEVLVDMDSQDYLNKYHSCETNRSKGIDEDKATYVCRNVLIPENNKDSLKITHYDNRKPGEMVTDIISPEKSLYVNLYLSRLFKEKFRDKASPGHPVNTP